VLRGTPPLTLTLILALALGAIPSPSYNVPLFLTPSLAPTATPTLILTLTMTLTLPPGLDTIRLPSMYRRQPSSQSSRSV